MVSEDLIKKVASQVAGKLTSARPVSAPAAGQKGLLVLTDSEAGLATALGQLRALADQGYADWRAVFTRAGAQVIRPEQITRELPNVEFLPLEAALVPEKLLARTDQILIPALSLSLAAKLAALQADSPVTNLCLQALLQRKRVIATTDTLVPAGSTLTTLPTGLQQALQELTAKLGQLGIELTTTASLGQSVRQSTWASSRGYALPVLLATGSSGPAGGSAAAHPSQELFNVPEEVAEFVDYLETKQCVLEPGKPCIGRGECRARGF